MRMRQVSFILVLATFVSGWASAQDVVRPEAAFPYELTATSDRLVLDFSLLDGYYLYQERFSFESETPGVTLGEPQFPPGELHSDEFFGEQEIYRHDFSIEIPYQLGGAAAQADLQIRLQGCADIGLCYPPQRWRRTAALPPQAGTSGGVADTIFGAPAATGGVDELLPPEQAFDPNIRFDRADELTVAWQIAPDYYLYRDKFIIETDGGIQLGAARLPAGRDHYDDNFGDIQVFYDYVEIVVPFSRSSPDEINVAIRAGYQGCKENSICYPPDIRTLNMVVPPTSQFAADGLAGGPAGEIMVSEQDRFSALIMGDSWLAFLGAFYLAGLALSLTPCVLPMVPILSSIIAGQGAVSSRRGFALSASYVLGMAITYTAAGALAALAGGQIQALFQKPWIIASFAGLFFILALGMFGLFELQMPAAVQTRLTSLANRQKGGTFIGTAIIGALSALIVTTCVAPPLVGALAVIGQTGDVTRGAAALFILSIGMGTPLLVVGASAGQLLPRVGPWMNTVKAAFGIMMIGVSIWMLERVLPGSVVLVLWALLLFLTGVFLGAFDPLTDSPRPSRRLAKGLGMLACLYGALMLIGATLGGQNPLRPFPLIALSPGGGGVESGTELDFLAVESVGQLDALLGQARTAGQPVMIDFTAEWCVSCKEMEAYTFPDAAVIAALEPFMLLRADVTANDDDDQALLQRFSSFGPPTIAFFDGSGREQEPYKLVGYVPAADFTAHVTRLASL